MGYSLGRWDDDTLIVDSAGDTDMLEAVCERSSEDWPGSLSDTADRANTRCSGDVNLEERLGKLDKDHQIVRDVGPRVLRHVAKEVKSTSSSTTSTCSR